MCCVDAAGQCCNPPSLRALQVTQDRNDLKMEEQNIICGALELHKKTVGEVMTKLDDVYMLNVDRNVDFNTINEIMQQGECQGDAGNKGKARAAREGVSGWWMGRRSE